MPEAWPAARCWDSGEKGGLPGRGTCSRPAQAALQLSAPAAAAEGASGCSLLSEAAAGTGPAHSRETVYVKPPGLATLTQAEANLRLPASVRCLSWPEGWDLSLLLVERVRGSQLLAGGAGGGYTGVRLGPSLL